MLKLWPERAGYGFVAFVALGFPLLVGFLLYLGFSDGITIGEGDPFRETRIFMVRDSRNVGIGWTSPSATLSDNGDTNQRCVRTQFSHLRVRPRLGITTTDEFCRCFVKAENGSWQTGPIACATR